MDIYCSGEDTMFNKTQKMIPAFVSFALLVVAVFGCTGIGDKTCGSGAKSLMLKRILNAGDDRAFDQALVAHGAITEDELPCVLDAVDSWSSTKRKNGAKALVLVGGDPKTLLEAQKKVVLETKDLFVWAKLMDSVMSPSAKANPADLAAKRHDMIAKALVDEDGFIQSVGLRAGVIGKYPGIESELKKRLDSMDPKLLAVALDALDAEKARAELPRLLDMLEEYESGTVYLNYEFKLYFFVPLVNALIKTEEPKAFLAVRTALEKGYKRPDQVRGTREEVSKFRNTAAVLKPDDSIKKFCYYLIDEKSILTPTAIDILTTQIWAKKQKPTSEIVTTCVKTIESGNLDPIHSREHFKNKPEQTSCERFFYFLETGENPMQAGKKRKIGSDAVKFGQKWLREYDNGKLMN